MSAIAVVRRAMFGLARMLERLKNGLVYAAAGTLTVHELRTAIARSWVAFNDTEEDIHSGLAAWEQSFTDRHIGRGQRVLLVGSGSGRDMLPLIERGCEVVGIEPAKGAADRARSALRGEARAVVIDGYFEDADLPGTFDSIVFSNFCYTCIPGSARRVAVLEKARAHLRPGGRIIVSFLYRQEPPHGRRIALGRMMGALTRSDWRMEPGDAISRSPLAPPALGYEHMFGPGELEREAAKAGLIDAGRGGHPHYEPWIVLVASSATSARATPS
jgi:SAM-dependent methyltransferase